MRFEEALERLEFIVQELERGDQTLEESLQLFEEGVRLSRLCARLLDEAEGRIEKLLEGSDGRPIVEPLFLEQEGAG